MKTTLYLTLAVFFVYAMHTCANARGSSSQYPPGLKPNCLDEKGNEKPDGPPKKTQEERIAYIEKCAVDHEVENCLKMYSGVMNRPRREVEETCACSLPPNYLE